MTPWRRHLRRLRFALTALVCVVLIGAAVFVGLVQAVLPWATHHPDYIAKELSARLHRPVTFASISSEWQPSGPLLTVNDLTLGPGASGGQSVTLPHAALKFDFGAWLRPAHRWITLRVSGVEMRVVHTAAGWRVDGFGPAEGQAHASLQSLPVDLDLSDVRVDIVDEVSGHAWRLFAPHLRAVNVGDSVRIGGFIQQQGTRQSVTVVGRMDAATRDYELYLSTSDLDFVAATRGLDLRGYSVTSGRGDVELWGRWRNGRLASARARYALHDLGLSSPDGRQVTVGSLSGVLGATRVADGWNFAWRGAGAAKADIDAAGGAIAQLRGHAGAWQVSGAARAVDLAPWLSLLALAPQAPRALADWVRKAQPHGRIDTAALQWREGGAYDLTARVSALAAGAAGKIPGLQLAHATFRADNAALSLELPPQAATVALTDVFRKPYVFEKLGGTLVAWRDAGEWNLAAPELHFEMGTVAGNVVARLAWPGKGHAPFLSAFAAVEHAEVPDADYFWPYRSMPPKLVAWLDHALVAGHVTSGRVFVRGPLEAWPFRNHEGKFEATGRVKDATFDFSDAWPRATQLDADVDFVNNSMRITADHVSVRGVAVDHAVATIPDLAHGVLGLDISGKGSGAALLDFVRHSPVGANAEDALAGLTVGGSGKFGVNLSIPLDDAEKFTLAGRVDLAKADVTSPQWQLALKNVTGPLLINGRGFTADGLAAGFRGTPAALSLAVAGGVSDPKDVVEASLDTVMSAQTLVQGYPDLAGLVAHAQGVAPFHIAVKVLAATANAPVTPILTVQSKLTGIALDFPAPLDKPAAAQWPMLVSLQLPPAGAPLSVSLGDRLQLRGRLADASRKLPIALAVNLGSAPPGQVPASGLVVTGHAPRLDVSGWIGQATGGGQGGSFPQLGSVNVTTGDAEVFGTSLGAMKIGFAAGAQEDTITLDGAAAKGSIQVSTSALMTRGISANLQHLYWPEAPAAQQPEAPTPTPASSPIAPSAVPPLHVAVADLRLGAAHLGKTSLESAPTLTGMHIAKFDSVGKDFSIRSSGDWNGTATASTSHFVTDITSQDFGDTLAAFGFKGLLAGGHKTHIHMDGTWPGSPSAFSLGWMDGSVKLDVGQGRILAVQPGFGRMLGLLSVRELPSRLALHFGDVFKSGFGFDHATATLRFADGNAFTNDMQIRAPAAQISMHGRVGFRARDFDLTVTAVPHLGATLPIVGAAIGGPVGAAAGLVVQGLLGKSINHAADNSYLVTGSWDKPKIVSVETPRVPLAGAVPQAGGSVAPAPAASVVAPAPATSLAGPAPTTSSPAASNVPSPAAAASVPPVPGASSSATPAPASSG
ncbi:MAG TPA: YhdP family protein [Rhodanobacteraceae bacterium]|nr:YhdP family protein [Rhodanobacteraceae bacterium]